MTRRQFIRASTTTGLLLSASPILSTSFGEPASTARKIDRRSVVQRHNPLLTAFSPFSALSLGNGNFAFTADITGLQTFVTECERDFPLCTASHWAWHTTPMPAGLKREDFRYSNYDTYGRSVGYATSAQGQGPLYNYLRENPHRLHLGRIGFRLKKSSGAPARPEDLKQTRQFLDLWSGLMDSRFELEGRPVQVRTCCDDSRDQVAVQIESPLLASGHVRVLLAFPYGSPEIKMADWTKPERHSTQVTRLGSRRARFARKLDQDQYYVDLTWSEGAVLEEVAPHEFELRVRSGDVLEFVCLFSPQPVTVQSKVDDVVQGSAKRWERFWTQGGAIDLGKCTDPRAKEIERRTILSLYQTAIHCAGPLPSPETGLLANSWYGKFHLEMHWWHSVHFTAWNRFPLFERTLGLYHRLLPLARETARRQGYRGVRWPKMIGPDGHDAPSPVGPLLIWQQPHPIYYAELCYRERPTRETLEYWREIVFETAEFMVSYPVWDAQHNRYVLGPPLKTVSENFDPLTAINPTFELAYWRFGLRLAQTWRERLKLPRDPGWEKVLNGLSPLPTQDGLYLLQEGMTDTYTKWNWEHPALIGALGMLPGDGVDSATMQRTVRRVMETWRWPTAWGWDFPMMAMAAARCGEPELAIRALLIDVPKNQYWPNGINNQCAGLTAYLPGNAGFLCAMAMMAAGWTGCPKTSTPGFPADGKWKVKYEELKTWM